MDIHRLSGTIKDIPSSGQYVASVFSSFVLSSFSWTSCGTTLTYKATLQSVFYSSLYPKNSKRCTGFSKA